MDIKPFHEAKRAFEKEYVEHMLLLTGGNCSEAARLAEKDRKDWYSLMERCKVRPGRFRRG